MQRWLEKHTAYVRSRLDPNRKHALQLTAMSLSRKYGESDLALVEIYDVVEIEGINTYQRVGSLHTSFLKSTSSIAQVLNFFREKHLIVNPEYTFLSVYSGEEYGQGDVKIKEILEERLKGILTPMPGDLLGKLKTSSASTSDVKSLRQKCYDALNDDFNTAIAISHLFEAGRIVNSVYAGTETITEEDKVELKNLFDIFLFEILGMKNEKPESSGEEVNELMKLLLALRAEAKAKKDFALSDKIRAELLKLNYTIKDEKDGVSWGRE